MYLAHKARITQTSCLVQATPFRQGRVCCFHGSARRVALKSRVRSPPGSGSALPRTPWAARTDSLGGLWSPSCCFPLRAARREMLLCSAGGAKPLALAHRAAAMRAAGGETSGEAAARRAAEKVCRCPRATSTRERQGLASPGRAALGGCRSRAASAGAGLGWARAGGRGVAICR